MRKSAIFVPSRRAIMLGAAATAAAAGQVVARDPVAPRLPTPEGTAGPGKILVWVDEAHWRSLMGAAVSLGGAAYA